MSSNLITKSVGKERNITQNRIYTTRTTETFYLHYYKGDYYVVLYGALLNDNPFREITGRIFIYKIVDNELEYYDSFI